MNKRAQLTAAIAAATTFEDQVRLVAELDSLDRQAVTAARAERETDWANDVVRQTLAPVRTHELHTASTEWISGLDTSGSDYHTAIIAEAAMWYGRVSPEVKADAEEFEIQARGMVRRQASRFGESASAAEGAALEYLSFLRRREGASGLPQIDQTVAPDGVTQQATPLPGDVFDNFSGPVHPINEGVQGTEGSDRGPLVEEIMGLNNGANPAEWQEGHQQVSQPTQPDNAPFHTGSVAIGHVMNMDQFRAQMRRAAASGESYPDPTDAQTLEELGYASPTGLGSEVFSAPGAGDGGMEVVKAAKTAADGDSSQVDDMRYPGNHGSTDQDGSAAIDRLVEATGLPAEQVRQKFPNPQEAVRVIDALGENQKAASLRSEAIYHEWYGEVSRPQLAAYRKHNISPSDHDDLVRHFGNDPAAITKWVKDQAATSPSGMVSTYNLGRDDRWASRREAASGLDQIQQTTAPDGVTSRPTPLPGDVAFPLIDDTEMNSQSLVNPDPTAAIYKAPGGMGGGGAEWQQGHQQTERLAALDDVSSASCRSCGESLAGAAATSGGGENATTCPSCGVKNYVQRKASRSFTPDDAMAHPEFFKGYGFARRWKTGSRLVRTGTAEFEAGLYAGITDNPENQNGWLAAHAAMASRHPEFGARIEVHDRFTRRVASRSGLRTQGAYVTATEQVAFPNDYPGAHSSQVVGDNGSHVQGGDYSCPNCGNRLTGASGCPACGWGPQVKGSRRQATTETDLSTSSPGTSPSPVGDTPINGPGRPGPLSGYEDPAAAGGPAPYNGSEPYGRPVVPGAIAPAQIVPPEVTHGAPPNPLANQQTVAFRQRVQAGLVALAGGE